MEEVRLWKIDQQKPGAARAARVDGINAVAAEKLLEDILAHSPEVLIQPTLVSRRLEHNYPLVLKAMKKIDSTNLKQNYLGSRGLSLSDILTNSAKEVASIFCITWLR